MSVFYDRFERHAHGEGLKAHATHYCAGCGHGIAQKYLAEAIEELGIKDRTIAISPVGCAVFLYYYLDVGNSQAPHGRAPAVALGHKLANPEAVVISYQGDGDLASIGLAEIVSTAQLGLPISVIFVNNAIYGMTGGQLAPTTLMGQKTSTSPKGRDRFMGAPLKMAELMAQLDGPIYVERVALFDAKQRVRAKKAIRRALEMQVQGKGFAFVEVLAECPTHLKATPQEAERFVREQMLPVFPLGVKKDVATEPWFHLGKPSFDVDAVLGAIGGAKAAPTKFASSFPRHLDSHDVSLKLAGAGGDGAQTAAMLIAQAAINEGFDATHIPSYGPESRGGTSYADVHVADAEVLSPASHHPQVLIAFNAPSLQKFASTVAPGGTILYDASVVPDPPPLPAGVSVHPVPMTEIASALGKTMVKNIVALGALSAATGLFPRETFLTAIRQALKQKAALIPMNEEAFARGEAAGRSSSLVSAMEEVAVETGGVS
ncbi:MAG TPA: 2-oxoacid:acceptor oxidoreductase family protein [Thermoanaerobaculia bacterium]|jgi:2-oxoisovalerate ferredoxin oxidoreductase beta subunit|nr:2-oxoacid:acceptor oxidoreductase family protein [Thermoanaerobaculia bacterium]